LRRINSLNYISTGNGIENSFIEIFFSFPYSIDSDKLKVQEFCVLIASKNEEISYLGIDFQPIKK